MKNKLGKRKCKYCGETFQKVNQLQFLCMPPKECSWKYAKEQKEKLLKVEWQKEKKEIKETLKTLGQYEQEARAVFQKWIRQRDKFLPCISCGNNQTNQWDAGHYWDANKYSGLIFHEDNVHKQCKQCNNNLHGNFPDYRIGLVKKIGIERVNWLEENKDRLRVYKYTKQELIEIKEKYTKLLEK